MSKSLKKEWYNELKDSAKDFMYYGYSKKSFLEYDSFSHIDKDVLTRAWDDAKKVMVSM